VHPESFDILPSARRHGIRDDQILHALRHPIRIAPINDEVTMVIGDDGSRGLIEVGIIIRTNHTMVIHAMTARSKFLR
jgi:hypothetical protein